MVVDVEEKKESGIYYCIFFYVYKEDEETIIGGCHRAGSANQMALITSLDQE